MKRRALFGKMPLLTRLKYQVEKGSWFTKTPRGSGRVGLWKDINKENKQLKLDSSFILGDGSRISFLERLLV